MWHKSTAKRPVEDTANAKTHTGATKAFEVGTCNGRFLGIEDKCRWLLESLVRKSFMIKAMKSTRGHKAEYPNVTMQTLRLFHSQHAIVQVANSLHCILGVVHHKALVEDQN